MRRRFDFKKKTPFEYIKDVAVEYGLSEDRALWLEKKWEKIGEVVIIKLPGISKWPKRMREFRHEWNQSELEAIGRAYAEVLNARCVAVEICGIEGELRTPKLKVIYGDRTETIHIENGVKYKLDVSKIMFSSGNINERIRMGSIYMADEYVYDMFAGIGYFTLPIALYSGCRYVIAVEKNAVAYEYLKENISINGVVDRVKAINADNRCVDIEDHADRVIMGYVKNNTKFLPWALKALKNKGIIHFHDTFGRSDSPEKKIKAIKRICSEHRYKLMSYSYRKIKSYAPSVAHGVFDLYLEEI